MAIGGILAGAAAAGRGGAMLLKGAKTGAKAIKYSKRVKAAMEAAKTAAKVAKEKGTPAAKEAAKKAAAKAKELAQASAPKVAKAAKATGRTVKAAGKKAKEEFKNEMRTRRN